MTIIHDGFSKPNVNPSLMTTIEEQGKTLIHYLVDPRGPRRQRRSKQRHHPYFTKTRTGGRAWEIGLRDYMKDKNDK